MGVDLSESRQETEQGKLHGKSQEQEDLNVVQAIRLDESTNSDRHTMLVLDFSRQEYWLSWIGVMAIVNMYREYLSGQSNEDQSDLMQQENLFSAEVCHLPILRQDLQLLQSRLGMLLKHSENLTDKQKNQSAA